MAHITITVLPGQTIDESPRVNHKKMPDYRFLQGQVCGYIETVPYLSSIMLDGKRCRCIAYCNEEGVLMNLPWNAAASDAWRASKGVVASGLVGPVVFVINANQVVDKPAKM